MDQIKTSTTKSLTTPTIDFLLLGGASLYVWVIMTSLSLFQADSRNQFYYLAMMFSWLSIVCNYPHFLISYRFGYGRGRKFILKNWPALIAMPVLFIILYLVAYLFFNEQIKSTGSVVWLNNILATSGMDFRLGTLPNLGIEILSLTVKIMFLTTGWHYSKQAFGCIMVFSHYHKYPLTRFQRQLWKMSLYSVAVYNVIYISNMTFHQSGAYSDYFGMPVTNSFFSDSFLTLALTAVILLAFLVSYFILYKNYKEKGMKPTSSILVPWISLHFWWIPFLGQHDFYFLAVPFFHSLQYLLFAYQLEAPVASTELKKKISLVVFKLMILFIAGYVAFSAAPKFLDQGFSTINNLRVMFFFVAIPVFINVHHFFIDSVVWRFSDEHVKEKLLN